MKKKAEMEEEEEGVKKKKKKMEETDKEMEVTLAEEDDTYIEWVSRVVEGVTREKGGGRGRGEGVRRSRWRRMGEGARERNMGLLF